MICRDAGGLLNLRDADWVGVWMDSGRAFHIIGDHFSHTEHVLAGLFGVRGEVLGGIEHSMRCWVSGNSPVWRWTDQHFLRSQIWRLARVIVLTHEPWFRYDSDVAAGTSIDDDPAGHAGANHSTSYMAIGLDQLDGSVVRWTPVEAAGQAVCSYAGTVSDRQQLVAIPSSTSARIQSGALQVRATAAAGAAETAGGLSASPDKPASRTPRGAITRTARYRRQAG